MSEQPQGPSADPPVHHPEYDAPELTDHIPHGPHDAPEEPPPGAHVVVAWIAAAGVVGALLRYGLALAVPTPAGRFPVATFATNLAGALLLGLLSTAVVGITARSELAKVVAGVGLLGAFTTFSTFETDALDLVRAHHVALALGYVAATVAGGLALAWVGFRAGARLRSGGWDGGGLR